MKKPVKKPVKEKSNSIFTQSVGMVNQYFKTKGLKGILLVSAVVALLTTGVLYFFSRQTYSGGTSILVIVCLHFMAMFGIVFLFLLPFFLKMKFSGVTIRTERFANKYTLIRIALTLFYSVLLSGCLCFGMVIIQNGTPLMALNWLFTNADVNWYMAWLIVSLIFFALAQTGKMWLPTGVLSILLFIISFSSYFKILYRGVPVYPWDILLVGVASSVISEYKLYLTAGMVMYLLMATGMVVLSCFYNFVPTYTKRRTTLVVRLTCMAASLCFVFTAGIRLFTPLGSEEQWTPALSYESRGALGTMFTYIKVNMPEPPVGYSEKEMLAIAEEIESKYQPTQNIDNAPDIIMVLSEAFFDITSIEGLNFDTEVLANHKEIFAQSFSGDMLSPAYGGGTSLVEFEILSGFSSRFLSAGSTPYQQFIFSPFSSYVSFLKDIGYETIAIHPYGRENWNRENVYRYMGFDRFIDIEDFDNPELLRYWATDEVAFNRTIKEYAESISNNDSPKFIFLITMQNHGGYGYDAEYWSKSDIELIDVKTEQIVDEELLNAIRVYSTILHQTDIALQKMIDYFEGVDRQVLVVYYGDHQPGIDGLYEQVQGLTAPGALVRNTVPFFAWHNNAKEPKKSELISANFLLPATLDYYQMPMPPFFSFLNKVKTQIPVYSSGLLLDTTYQPIENLTEEQQKLLWQNELLQYDYMFGNKYAGILFPEPEAIP